WRTMRWSDDSPGAASHFACAYRVASPGATREPCESSWGHVMVFCTVPPANTLIRWVDERRLRPHSAGSTLPHLWPTGSSRGGPHRLRPGTSPHALRIPPHGGHPALRVMRGGCRSPLAVSGFRLRARLGFSIPSSPRPARNYPRFWIRHPSFGRRRDLNPPDHPAAQRTLRDRPTSHVRESSACVLGLPDATCWAIPTGEHGISRFSRKVFPHMHGVSDRAGFRRLLRWRCDGCCLPPLLTASAPRRSLFA